MPVAPGRNGMAVAALVMAMCGLVTLGVTAPVGAILGHTARKRIRTTGEQGDGLARAAIIIGWIFTGLGLALCGLFIVGALMPTVVHTS
jgi:Domain of unknown function (DUF4190)